MAKRIGAKTTSLEYFFSYIKEKYNLDDNDLLIFKQADKYHEAEMKDFYLKGSKSNLKQDSEILKEAEDVYNKEYE